MNGCFLAPASRAETGQEPTFGTGAKFRVLRHRLCGSANYASTFR